MNGMALKTRAKPSKRAGFFPVIEIKAESHLELGFKTGQAAKAQIKEALARRREWIGNLKKFANADRGGRVTPFVEALKRHFPQYLDELTGMAQGAEADLDDLLIINLNPELNAMMQTAKEEDCSTVVVRNKDRVLLGHNEDGSEEYLGLMFLLRAQTPNGTRFMTLCYPGLIPGNGPGINSHGLIHTCDYIGNKQWRAGVPRYFIDRAILEARSIDEAASIASHQARAYSQAHNLISFREKQAVMIETSVSQALVREVKGMVARANHYLFPEMKCEPEFAQTLKRSRPRQAALEDELRGTRPGRVGPEQILAALSSHRNQPLSPCRHKNRETPGATLGTFIFDGSSDRLEIYFGAPCARVCRVFQPALAN